MNAYVVVHVTGNRTERLLERMRHANISIYSLQRLSASTVELTISAKDFKRLPSIARSSGCSIHIAERLGIAFPIQKLFRRYALWVGCFCMFCLFLFASTRILWIDIDGCSHIAEQTVLRALSEEGIFIGSSRKGLDFTVLNNRLRLYDDRIAWIGLSLNGSILHAEIVESIPTTDEENLDTPAEIVAQKSGRITRIESDAGRAVVQIGDSVSAGDVLITGNLTTEASQYPVYAHAAGRVYAEVAYITEVIADREIVQLVDSGNSVPYRELQLAGKSLFITDIPYANYVLRNCSTTSVTDTLLPVQIIEGSCYEQTEQTVLLSMEEMAESAMVEAEQLAYLKIPKDAAITKKETAWMESDGQAIGIVTILTEESIGLTKEIDIDGTDGQYEYLDNGTTE